MQIPFTPELLQLALYLAAALFLLWLAVQLVCAVYVLIDASTDSNPLRKPIPRKDWIIVWSALTAMLIAFGANYLFIEVL